MLLFAKFEIVTSVISYLRKMLLRYILGNNILALVVSNLTVINWFHSYTKNHASTSIFFDIEYSF